jgi:DNA-binding LacI/PurR family transcriptional regulator
MSRRPSLLTVAEAAGVSRSTVSNAYNRPDQLSEAVRRRVLDVAAELGYAGPDPAASALRTRRTGSIGVLFAQPLTYAFADPYCADLLTGVAEVVTATGTNLLLLPVGPHAVSRAHSREEELRLVQGVRQAALDGAVADGLHEAHPLLRVLAERGIPVVTTDGTGERGVVVDDRAAGEGLGRHLRALGHRRVAVLADSMDDGEPVVGPDEATLFPYSRLRLDGVRAGLGAAADVVPVSAGQNVGLSGRLAAALLLAAPDPPTCVVATTDVLALGVLEVLRERGVEVGAAMSVTGFDDVPEAAAAGLTTVRQPVREKGRVLARMLLDPELTEARVTLPTELVVRTTTGPAPA